MRIDQLVKLNAAIHDPKIKSITIDGDQHDVNYSTQGLRYINHHGIKYIQQNPYKDTFYASMARIGQKIMWGIRPGKWILVIDDEVKVS